VYAYVGGLQKVITIGLTWRRAGERQKHVPKLSSIHTGDKVVGTLDLSMVVRLLSKYSLVVHH
jgi:hypothetical protein